MSFDFRKDFFAFTLTSYQNQSETVIKFGGNILLRDISTPYRRSATIRH